MNTIIYLDVLIIEGVIINYLLLLCTATFTAAPKNRARMFTAALLGGVASLMILLPERGFIADFAVKTLVTLVILKVAFKVNYKAFVKCTLWYILFNCLLSGLLLLIYYFGYTDLHAKNFQLYIDISPLLLVGTTVLLYIIVKVLCYFLIKPDLTVLQCTIIGDTHRFSLAGVYDSAFVATDILQEAPLVLLSYPAVSNMLAPEHRSALKAYFTNFELCEGFTLLPIDGIGGSELLPALYPVSVMINGKEVQKVKLCFTNRDINIKGAGCLLSKEFMEVYSNVQQHS